MEKTPRNRNQGLLILPLISHSYLFLGLLEGMWSLFLFFYVLKVGGWRYGQSLASTSPLYHSAFGVFLIFVMDFL